MSPDAKTCREPDLFRMPAMPEQRVRSRSYSVPPAPYLRLSAENRAHNSSFFRSRCRSVPEPRVRGDSFLAARAAHAGYQAREHGLGFIVFRCFPPAVQTLVPQQRVGSFNLMTPKSHMRLSAKTAPVFQFQSIPPTARRPCCGRRAACRFGLLPGARKYQPFSGAEGSSPFFASCQSDSISASERSCNVCPFAAACSSM